MRIDQIEHRNTVKVLSAYSHTFLSITIRNTLFEESTFQFYGFVA